MISWLKNEIRGMDNADLMFHIFIAFALFGLLIVVLSMAPLAFLTALLLIGAGVTVIYTIARLLRWWAQ